MRIVFMGTPEFARTILERLVADRHEICGVFTQPDKPGNRGKIKPSAVKQYALEHDFPVYQPVKMRDGTVFAQLQELDPEMIVVAAYGRILPEDILALPPMGCINVHGSILPKYRGAAPINRAILDGETETGVTIMHMAKECDTGDMILVKTMPIPQEMNAEELFAELAKLGADAISEAIVKIADGTAERIPQDHSKATYASMLSRELSPIDWSNTSTQILNQIRGLIPWPCASTLVGEQAVKVYRAERGSASSEPAGKMKATKRGIEAVCGNGESILITELQAEGGKRMAANAYLNGKRIAAGTYLN